MDIPSVLISDTNGSLASDLFKIHVDNPTISASLTDEVSKSRMLTVALDNVRLDSVPNIHNSTYKIFLAYNGTLGYSNKVFTTVVKEIKGTFDSSNIPVLSFDPGMVSRPQSMLDEVVIDIKMFNGSVDVLRYAQGELHNGENILRKRVRAYPTQITGMPNMVGDKVIMDGYSYTAIILKYSWGATVVKDTFML
jgi:hypothetical protein